MVIKCATNLRRDFFNIMKLVQEEQEPVLIANRQGPNIVIMTEDEYESILTTIDILKNPIECDKVIHPDFKGQRVYDTVDEIVETIAQEKHV